MTRQRKVKKMKRKEMEGSSSWVKAQFKQKLMRWKESITEKSNVKE